MRTCRGTRGHFRRSGAVAVAVAVVTGGCGDGGAETAPSGRAAPSSAVSAAVPDPATEGARRAAEQFLAALAAQEPGVAYDLLTPRVQGEVTREEFVAAREAKAGSARILGRQYEVTAVMGEGDSVTVTGEGRLSDATKVTITLPLVLVGADWRVDQVPTAF